VPAPRTLPWSWYSDPDVLRRELVPVDDLVFHSRDEYELTANWEIGCENYLECYHCPVAQSFGPLPAGPQRSTGFLDYFFAADADGDWVEELLAFDKQVGAEDRVLVERVQKGVRSGSLEEGRLLGESEQLVAPFQELVGTALS
jgi:phenylpropionate dioxygenase-like ring-hydroxylating dioxygenase large terminal subunit